MRSRNATCAISDLICWKRSELGSRGLPGRGCGELVGNVVVDERLVALFGTGVVGVADELELTVLGGVVVELELHGRSDRFG